MSKSIEAKTQGVYFLNRSFLCVLCVAATNAFFEFKGGRGVPMLMGGPDPPPHFYTWGGGGSPVFFYKTTWIMTLVKIKQKDSIAILNLD